MHRKEVLADLSRVVRRATPGALAPSGLARDDGAVTSPVGPDGEVVIPKHLRDQLEIAPGVEVQFALEGAAIRIELVRDAPNLRGSHKGRSLVVSRIYRMTFADGVWIWHREVPGFHQRFQGTVDPSGNHISASWTKSHDDDVTWQHDFDLTYTGR
jgi:bifunctional DNA-binding transcriptional regulator/antitoxin component of YhaV-PrlF toxin-antitoxin module